MAAVAASSQRLLDFSQPIDVPLLDATVNAFYGAGSPAEVVQITSAESDLKTPGKIACPSEEAFGDIHPLVCSGAQQRTS